ncbi:PaaX family transcriptional regulator [Gandjariella thermophila]|uniref:PaaX family transcriptional regulator n=1 Tax=Gandjariella thermophila TaxID=1931992 RepID=A0A4D4JDD1_9PSEU|nr:PaaX family transcriptional regulator C-terminal domain-containing protein [Gandjariella thermophila]GDY31907.1 PaaX family transcriptional regulator [Gandjariella thermophila]
MAEDVVDGRGIQPRHLIVTVCALFADQLDGWFPVASLVRLLADLGVDEPAVRSSISRLKRRGLLEARRVRGAAGYELSDGARRLLHDGHQRAVHQSRPAVADGWLLAVFSVPEAERGKRHTLRSQLTRLGFGTAAPGVWIAPAHLHQETAAVLDRHGLRGYVELFRADHLSFVELPAKVAEWWDLDGLQQSYADFLARYRPVWRRWSRRRAIPEREAFADIVRMHTEWRLLPYADPGLPRELLPKNWNGSLAAELFASIDRRLTVPARRHVNLARLG